MNDRNRALPVIQFSYQDFKPIVRPQMTLGELDKISQEAREQAFLVHDPAFQASALVQRDTVLNFRKHFSFEDDETAGEVGLYDILRANQMSFSCLKPAREIARVMQAYEIGFGIALNTDHVPVGLFVPQTVLRRLPETSLVKQSPDEVLNGLLRAVEQEDLFAAVQILERAYPDFHSERIQRFAPDGFRCEGNGGHFTDRCDCHPGERCTPVQLSIAAF